MSTEFEGLDLVTLLNLLEPATQPEPVPWTPQTAGWIWLGLAVAALLYWGVRRWVAYRKANAYRKDGLAALRLAKDDPVQIARVLRRTALAGFPRTDVASLTGDAWLGFLDATFTAPSEKQSFAKGVGRDLALAPYRDTGAIAGLGPLAALWIRTHKNAAKAGQEAAQ